MKNPSKIISSVVMVVLPYLFPFIANAQKLPTVQQKSLRPPVDIKVDGNSMEWNNKFQAYNNHTDFYYTLSNDDDILYLTIQAVDPEIIKRILNGAITLTINNKDKTSPVSITYPVFEKNDKFYPNFKPKSGTKQALDTLASMNNARMVTKAKFIKTIGIKGIDTLISVYNTDGIKAASLFDNMMAYTYEVSIALKHLGLLITNSKEFTYQIKINEVASEGVNVGRNDAGGISRISIGGGAVIGQAATDFSGKYTLEK